MASVSLIETVENCLSALIMQGNIAQIKERFLNNASGFWRANIWILAVYLASLLLDGISTIHFMLRDGTDAELHPAVNLVSRIAGPISGPLIGVAFKAVAGIIVAIYWRRICLFILIIAGLISLWAAWYNAWGWQMYEPVIYLWWPFS